jgi:hypothetical protein
MNLNGLSEKLREHAPEFCTKDWRLSSHDTNTTDPVFKELKDFIATKTKATQKKIVYNKKYAIRNDITTTIIATTTTTIARTTSNDNISSVSPSEAITASTPTSAASDITVELTAVHFDYESSLVNSIINEQTYRFCRRFRFSNLPQSSSALHLVGKHRNRQVAVECPCNRKYDQSVETPLV